MKYLILILTFITLPAQSYSKEEVDNAIEIVKKSDNKKSLINAVSLISKTEETRYSCSLICTY